MNTYHRSVIAGTDHPAYPPPTRGEAADLLHTQQAISVCYEDWDRRAAVMIHVMHEFDVSKKIGLDFKYNRYLAVKLYWKIPAEFEGPREELRKQIEHTFGLNVVNPESEDLVHLMRKAFDPDIDQKLQATKDIQIRMDKLRKENADERQSYKDKHQTYFDNMKKRQALIDGGTHQ